MAAPVVAALAPLFAEAAASAASERLASSLTGAMSSARGEGEGFGLSGKVPKQFTAALKLAFPALALFTKALEPIGSFAKALEDWGDSLLDSQRGLMAFNGAIAGTIIEAERRDIVRKIGQGQRTASSTQFMSEQLSDIKDAIQPFQDAVTNGFNILAGHVLKTGNNVIHISKGVSRTAFLLGKLADWMNSMMDRQNAPFARFIGQIEKGLLEGVNPEDRDLMGGVRGLGGVQFHGEPDDPL